MIPPAEFNEGYALAASGVTAGDTVKAADLVWQKGGRGFGSAHPEPWTRDGPGIETEHRLDDRRDIFAQLYDAIIRSKTPTWSIAMIKLYPECRAHFARRALQADAPPPWLGGDHLKPIGGGKGLDCSDRGGVAPLPFGKDCRTRGCRLGIRLEIEANLDPLFVVERVGTTCTLAWRRHAACHEFNKTQFRHEMFPLAIRSALPSAVETAANARHYPALGGAGLWRTRACRPILLDRPYG